MTTAKKKILSALLIAIIFICGFAYQKNYNTRKVKNTAIITGFYKKYFHREPDTIGLQHWVNWSLTKWSLAEVEQHGFIEAVENKEPHA